MAKIYKEKIVPQREQLFGLSNVMAVPRIDKVVINARIKKDGNASEEKVVDSLTKITGQKPVITKARKSISNFKIRQGMAVGAKVTLRGARAIDFLDRLINVTLPRVRDFSGLGEKNLDQDGNLNIGLNEHIVFPETASDDISQMHGLQITVSTTTRDKKQALILLKELGFPFKSTNFSH